MFKIKYKVCTKCKKRYLLNSKNFCKSKKCISGFFSQCKTCINKYKRDWYLKNSEKYLIYQKKYRRDNPEFTQRQIQKCQERIYVRRHGISRKSLLKLWNNECAICRKRKYLIAYRVNLKVYKNLNDIVVLCRQCSLDVSDWYQKRTLKARKLWCEGRISECLMCKTNKRRHSGNGLCTKCYEITRKEYKKQWWIKKKKLINSKK